LNVNSSGIREACQSRLRNDPETCGGRIYRSSADFLREAVRDKLRTMEVISLRGVDLETAEKMIIEYLKKNPGSSFVSEIADALGIEYTIAFKAAHNLIEKGVIRKRRHDTNRRRRRNNRQTNSLHGP